MVVYQNRKPSASGGINTRVPTEFEQATDLIVSRVHIARVNVRAKFALFRRSTSPVSLKGVTYFKICALHYLSLIPQAKFWRERENFCFFLFKNSLSKSRQNVRNFFLHDFLLREIFEVSSFFYLNFFFIFYSTRCMKNEEWRWKGSGTKL